MEEKELKTVDNKADGDSGKLDKIEKMCIRDRSPEEQEKAGVTEDQVRLSIGLENIDDIIEDLEIAFSKI